MPKTTYDIHISGLEHTEVWLAVPGFEGLYEVSDLGRVRSLDRMVTTRNGRTRPFHGQILSPQLRSNTGYLMVALSKQGIVTDWYIHRLVLTTFCGEPEEGYEGCHNNDIRTDNRLENLRWDTHLANVGDAISRGRHRSIGSYNGEKTECHRGHPFDEENTFIRPEGRSCKECRRINERARYHSRKAA